VEGNVGWRVAAGGAVIVQQELTWQCPQSLQQLWCNAWCIALNAQCRMQARRCMRVHRCGRLCYVWWVCDNETTFDRYPALGRL
jgi:hypothetical protein